MKREIKREGAFLQEWYSSSSAGGGDRERGGHFCRRKWRGKLCTHSPKGDVARDHSTRLRAGDSLWEIFHTSDPPCEALTLPLQVLRLGDLNAILKL